jgi:hypothetical protein
MSNYRYLQLNESNFEFFASIFGSTCRGELTRCNIKFGQAVVDNFITTDRYRMRSCIRATSVFWYEYPEWLKDEPKWEHRHLRHILHPGGFFRFEMQDNKVVSVSWLGYRVDVGELPLQVAGKQVSSNELRLVLEGVTCSDTRAQIIEDWSSMLSEDFLAKYYK